LYLSNSQLNRWDNDEAFVSKSIPAPYKSYPGEIYTQTPPSSLSA
jgi:hypothetical protein